VRKRGSWNDCKSQCTTLFDEQQKFTDRFKYTPSVIYVQHNFYSILYVGCNSTTYVYSYLLGAEIYEEHHKAWNVNG